MHRIVLSLGLVGLAAASVASTSHAAIPFNEDFTSSAANWRYSDAIALTFTPAGGPDGSGYVTRTFPFSDVPAASSSRLVFRAHDEYGSSGVAYAGNWIADGVKQVHASFRHTAPEPLVFNARFASVDNFPGASYYTDPVPPNVWTPVTFRVHPGSPQNVTYEGSNHGTIFSAIGHMQFGVNIPLSLKGGTTPFTFDMDQVAVSTIPEPATGLLGAVAAAAIAFVQKRRTR